MPDTPPLFLYIEDDLASRQVMDFLMTRILRTQLVMFENTDHFSEKLAALPSPPKAVFLDIHVGPIDGYESLAVLRGMDQFQHIPIIAMTASVTSLDVEQVKKAGFDGLIGKPIKSQAFPDLLKRILLGEPVWFVT